MATEAKTIAINQKNPARLPCKNIAEERNIKGSAIFDS
jgi:hypothetical protein